MMTDNVITSYYVVVFWTEGTELWKGVITILPSLTAIQYRDSAHRNFSVRYNIVTALVKAHG